MAFGGLTDLTEAGILDYLVTTYGATNKYLGLLYGTQSDDAGAGLTEPAIGTGAYARVLTTNAADWAAAVAGAPSSKANNAAKGFPTATATLAGGVNMVAWGMYIAATGGAPIVIGLLSTPKPVLLGDTPNFPIGSLVIKLGDPGESY